MASRSVKVTATNRSDVQFVVSHVEVDGGIWTPGMEVAPGTLVLETDNLIFQTESDGILTGTSGRVVLSSANLDPFPRELSFRWDNPYVGANSYSVERVPAGLDAWFEGGDGDNAEVTLHIAASTDLDCGFRPSSHGWHFSNSAWANVPNASITIIPGLATIPIGSASDGMCGGMTYSATDYFVSGRGIPTINSNPAGPGDPHFDYIAARLWDSFHLVPGDPSPGALTTYVSYMAWTPDQRADLCINQALPKIRAAIATGIPAALGLIGAHASGVIDIVANLGKNHQVSAYAYRRNGDQVWMGIYDCNRPDVDDLYIQINASELTYPQIDHNTSMSQILAFFETGYSYNPPP